MSPDDFSDLGAPEHFQQGPKCADIVRRLICHFIPPIPPAATPHRDRECDLRVQQFIAYDRQVEGWFKGEIMLLLSKMQKDQIINKWWPEVTYDGVGNGRTKCDFVVEVKGLDDEPVIVGIEVKVAFVGTQWKRQLVVSLEGVPTVVPTQGATWGLDYILTEGRGDRGGVLRDAVRLCRSDGLTEKICLIYAYGDGAPSDPWVFAKRLSARGEKAQVKFSARILREDQPLFQGGGGFIQPFACWIKPKAQGDSAKARRSE